MCCDNKDKLPKIDCERSECTTSNCGYKWLESAFKSHPNTHSFDQCQITYDQIEIIEYSESGKPVYGIQQHTVNYHDFLIIYITAWKKYIGHHCTYIWQYTQKLNLLSSLHKNALLTRWDYIHNPKVQYYHKTNNQWGQITKFALMIGVDNWFDEYDMESKTLTTDTKTSSYFCKDPKHDFNHALNVIDKHFESSIASHRSKTQQPLNIIYNRSDRGEFLCTAFLDGLSVISYERDITIMWDTGEANHNKDICDAEGHTDKSALRRGVTAKKLLYEQGKEHVVTAAEYCAKYFSGRKRKREFIPVLDKVNHPKSGEVMKEALKGISKYYCFGFFKEPHIVYGRIKSCYCKYCLLGQWSLCINLDNVGIWHRHKLKLNLYYNCGYKDPRKKKRQKIG